VSDPRPHLRALLDATQGDQVACPRLWLEALLAEPARPARARDLTVDDLCQRFDRKPSAVRAWLEAGRLPGAYKLNGREWRVPPAVLEAFEVAQRAGQGSGRAERQEEGGGANLGAWRTARGGQAA
jgi:hypothetical protein